MKQQVSDAEESESDEKDDEDKDEESSMSEDHDERLVLAAKEMIIGVLMPQETVRQALKRL